MDPKNNDKTEQQLRREIDDLRMRLREHEASEEGVAAANRWKPSGLTITALVLAILVLFAVAFYAGYTPMQKREAAVLAETQEQKDELPRMEVLRVSRSSGDPLVKLPATLQAVTEAPILARADGYLKRRLVDIGDRVTAGQPLAEIDAPEIDQQIRQAEAAVDQVQASLEQAEASLQQGIANRELARITAGRWRDLAAQGVVSKQENDQHQAELTAQTASVQALEKAVAAQRSSLAASKANVARLQEVQSYRVVKAPFDGIVTQRNVDLGALVSAGNTLLYRISQSGMLRTYLNVPQSSANQVRTGQPAVLTVSNFPGRRFRGTIARTANALDPASRTMLVEVDLPNGDGTLLPGMFGEVELASVKSSGAPTIPAAALIVRTDGAQVATVSRDGVLHLAKVLVGRDFGDRVEIVQGLDEGATIVAVPSETAREGAKIIPVAREVEQP